MHDTDQTTRLLPVLPLAGGVVLPSMVVTIALETDEARAAVAAAGDDDPELLLLPRHDGRYAEVGVIADVESRGTLPGGTPALVVRAGARARVRRAGAGTGEALWLEVDPVEDGQPSERAAELATELRAALATLAEQAPRPLRELLGEVRDPAALADSAGAWPHLDLDQRITLLETLDLEQRLSLVLGWAEDALAEAEVRERIRSEVSSRLEGRQREVLLREQLAAIRAELGEGDAADDEVEQYRQRFAELTLPEAVAAAVDTELDRLERTPSQAAEHGWIRTWLDTVAELPWGRRSEDRLDLDAARAVLDADHTGLERVKERVIEHLAVRKLRTERGVDDADAAGRRGAGTILALVGPPGVGKTSLGESVASALGRSFVRVALGGVRDEAEIRGHRRTYVGARPGRIVRALTDAGSMNPVLLLDEVDKVGADWRGDPSAALLEVLDPAQNHTFRDHYLELELDLSDVLFVATANTLETIPGPLRDRLEIISLEGYTDDEKVAIARDHLVARQLRRNGLTPDEVHLDDETLAAVVEGWTREAGVRELERQVGRIMRRAATDIATRPPVEEADDGTAPPTGTVSIGVDDLPEVLGRPRHRRDDVDPSPGVGVVNGLAVTGVGGDVLVVEAAAMARSSDGEPGLTLTGQLGDVMEESGQIALSVLRADQDRYGIAAAALDRRLHVHFPAGAVPKDGPSAGITMTTALASLLTGRPVRPSLGMTGEVTLSGRVLPIGGVRQKLLAAQRAGLEEVILPARNEPDLDDVPESVTEQVTIHLVSHIDEVLDLALVPAATTT